MTRTLILFGWLIGVLVFKVRAKISFIFSLFMLFASFFLILLNYGGRGLRFSTYAYGFALIGVLVYLWELSKSGKNR
jgi:hypothetical protein